VPPSHYTSSASQNSRKELISPSMQNKDIRWKQRFQNFERSLKYLEQALSISRPDIIQKAGLIQFFEMSFELAWNVLKDYLEEQGFIDIKSPRSALKKAFETGLIQDGHSWMKLLDDRNLTSHAYDEATVDLIEKLIHQKYYPLLKQLYDNFYSK
jgi:nucleotidyltransferase substrate binding protein (TIGR01987 family)